MAYSAPALAVAAKASIDYYLKNNPIDQIKQERPLLQKLMAKRTTMPGGLQYAVEQLISDYGEQGQWVQHADTLDFNARNPNEQAKYIWSTYRDGMGVSEDEASQNGFVLTDDRNAKASESERVALVNLMETKTYALKEGMHKGLDYQLHLDGTQDAKSIPGLDALIAVDPTAGTVGGLNRATATWFRNDARTGVAAADLMETLEQADRATRKHGGKVDFILAGAAFIDAYRAQAKGEIERHIVLSGKGGTGLDGGVTDLWYKGIPIIWDPTFEDLDAALSPADNEWTKRAYFINTNHLKLRPIEGHDFVITKPERPYNQYVHYWDFKFKGALTMNRSNAHGVVVLA